MKITKSQLKQIIREEVRNTLNQNTNPFSSDLQGIGSQVTVMANIDGYGPQGSTTIFSIGKNPKISNGQLILQAFPISKGRRQAPIDTLTVGELKGALNNVNSIQLLVDGEMYEVIEIDTEMADADDVKPHVVLVAEAF